MRRRAGLVGAAAVVALLLATAASVGGAGAEQARHTSAVRPVEGPVVRAFDPPGHPYGAGHRGVDLSAEPGAAVRSALAGIVTFSGEVARRGWITVDHGGGLDTTYGVLDPRAVPAGRHVGAGEVLGYLAPDAAHLDWGARLHGDYIDPLLLLGRWRPHLVGLPER